MDAGWRVVEVPAGRRGAYEALLRLADDSTQEIERYRDQGELLGMIDASTGEPLGEVLVVPTEETGTVELRSVAVVPERQGFRPWRIERDRFTVERGYAPDLREDGLRVRDMIWLDRTLVD